MLIPTSADVLRCIERTLDREIKPTLSGPGEKSAAATIGHLLRHVILRIDNEGRMLFEEIGVLKKLLSEVQDYLSQRPGEEGASTPLQARLKLLAAESPNSGGYRGVAQLADEVSALRQGVSDSLGFLQDQMPEQLGAPGTQLHESLLEYVAWEILQEGKLIDPAFDGFGPRR